MAKLFQNISEPNKNTMSPLFGTWDHFAAEKRREDNRKANNDHNNGEIDGNNWIVSLKLPPTDEDIDNKVRGRSDAYAAAFRGVARYYLEQYEAHKSGS